MWPKTVTETYIWPFLATSWSPEQDSHPVRTSGIISPQVNWPSALLEFP